MTSQAVQAIGGRAGALLLAGLLLGGCVRNDAMQPEGASPVWEYIENPRSYRINGMVIDGEGKVIMCGRESYPGGVEDIIYASMDNGEHWTKAKLGEFHSLQALSADSEGRLFAEESGYGSRVIKSVDHGETWKVVIELPSQSYSNRLVVDANDDIYVPTVEDGIFFSDDHGDSWMRLADDFPAEGHLHSISANSSGILFATASKGVYRSADRGATWIALQGLPTDKLRGEILIDSMDRVYLSLYDSLYRSANDGETWTAFGFPAPGYSLTIGRGDKLILLHYVGISMSADGGERWNTFREVGSSPQYAAYEDPAVFFAAGEWGLIRSIDGGASWEMLGFGIEETTDFAIGKDGSLYIGKYRGGIWRSASAAGEWKVFNQGFPNVTLYCLASTHDSVLVAGTSDGVYISPEDRPDWSRAGLPGRDVFSVYDAPDAIFACLDRELFISTDGGTTWRDIGLTGYDITSIAAANDGAYLAAADFGGVFRYTGEGALWDQTNECLDDLRVASLAVGEAGEILAGTPTGVFILPNGETCWRRLCPNKESARVVLYTGDAFAIERYDGIQLVTADGCGGRVSAEGLSSYGYSAVILKADSAHHLYLLFYSDLYRSAYPFAEMPLSGR